MAQPANVSGPQVERFAAALGQILVDLNGMD
jgi:hypothetical protein